MCHDAVMTISPDSFATLLDSVRSADEDYEWYPTTDRMISAVARWLGKSARAIMDVGAGDGRVLCQLAEVFERPPELYAIEKSNVLIQAQPENVIPVGTDLFEQNLSFIPVDYIFCNPPYSEYELWASVIIESGHAKKAFLVIPQRWKANEGIAIALKKRGATARVIHSDDFKKDADRTARAVIDIVEISYPMEGTRSWSSDKPKDPFDIWFDAHVSTFDEEKAGPEETTELTGTQKAPPPSTIAEMVNAYNAEHERMEMNYRAIFQLDYELLRELGVKRDAIRDGIKVKMAGLKTKYWTMLFERLDVITERLSTATKAKFLEKLTGRASLAFTVNNAYAVVLWAIKNANKYFDEQTVQLYRDLSTHDGVLKYKSNLRTWVESDWRYRHEDENELRPSHYALDYRIVLHGYRAIGTGESYQYDYPGNLSKSCHEKIADIVAVLYNLGFRASWPRSHDRRWESGGWQNWHLIHDGEEDRILFQVKAYMNGNMHLRFMPDAIKALNVEAGRLLGWLRSADEVVAELGYTPEEASKLYACTRLIAISNVPLLGGSVEAA